MCIVVHLERGGPLGVVGPLDAVVELFEQPRCGARDGLVDLADYLANISRVKFHVVERWGGVITL